MFNIFNNQPISRSFQKKEILIKNSKDKKGSLFHSSGVNSQNFKTSLMNHLFEIEFNNEIDSFMLDLESLQEKIIKRPTLELIKEYRDKIGFFLEKLLSHYQSHSYLRSSLKSTSELKIWKSINTELETISKKVIAKNISGMTLLKNFGVIKGLILDLKVGKN